MDLPIPLPFIYLFIFFFERSSSVSSHKNWNYMRKMIFQSVTQAAWRKNIRVLLNGVEPCNDLVVTSPDTLPLIYKRVVGATLHNAGTKSRYVLMRHDRDWSKFTIRHVNVTFSLSILTAYIISASRNLSYILQIPPCSAGMMLCGLFA